MGRINAQPLQEWKDIDFSEKKAREQWEESMCTPCGRGMTLTFRKSEQESKGKNQCAALAGGE